MPPENPKNEFDSLTVWQFDSVRSIYWLIILPNYLFFKYIIALKLLSSFINETITLNRGTGLEVITMDRQRE